MDKAQATRYVLDSARAGLSAAEISAALGRELGAPVEITRRFVERVLAEQGRPNQGAPSAPAPEIPLGAGLPPGLQRILTEYEAAGAPPPAAQTSKPGNTPGEDLPHPGQVGAPRRRGASPEKHLQPAVRARLTKIIIRKAQSGRSHNAIVETICKETGWHWNDAQRFVGQVLTQHHDEVQRRHIPWATLIGASVMLLGLFFVLGSGKWLADYAKLAVFAKTNPNVLLEISPAAAFFALASAVIGAGMLVGGGYALGRGLTDQ